MLITEDTLQTLFDQLSREDTIVVDTETNGLRPYHGDRIWGVSLYFPEQDVSYYVPVRYEGEYNVTPEQYADLLKKLSHKHLVFFNALFDLHMLSQDGMPDPDSIEDVMVLAHILNENEHLTNGGKVPGAYKLKRLADKYLGSGASAPEAELDQKARELGLNSKTEMWKLPAHMVAPYAENDVIITWKLANFYYPALKRWDQEDFYVSRNKFVLKVLFRMERNGLYVDDDIVNQLIQSADPRMAEISEHFNRAVNPSYEGDNEGLSEVHRINLNSPAQVKKFFGAATSDKYVLTALANQGNEYAKLLLEYRQLAKASSTYYKPFLDWRDPDGYIHPHLNPIGTVAGRPSSYEPNFQNIPRKGKYEVKKAIKPRPGYSMLQLDYAQLELRLAVHFTQQPTMLRMMLAGEDLHQYTADQLGVDRYTGKTSNFSFLYGAGGKRAALMLGLDEKEGYRIVNAWNELYPEFKEAYRYWQHKAMQKQENDFQYIRLWNGRIRHFHEQGKYPYTDKFGRVTYGNYQTTWNNLVQGTGWAIMEDALIKICEDIPDNRDFIPTLTVHDSVMVDVRPGTENYYAEVMKEIMIDYPFTPQLAIDAKHTQESWYEL